MPPRSDLFYCWFAKQKSFSPQPYEQLALVFQNQGRDDEARAIRYAGRERERSESGGFRYAWLTMLDWTIGYGHHIDRALFWTMAPSFCASPERGPRTVCPSASPTVSICCCRSSSCAMPTTRSTSLGGRAIISMSTRSQASCSLHSLLLGFLV